MSEEPVKSISLLVYPYHTILEAHRVGAGPHRILTIRLLDRLQSLGCSALDAIRQE